MLLLPFSQGDFKHMGELFFALYKSACWIDCALLGPFFIASQAGFTPATSFQAYSASKLENCDKAKHLNR